MNNSINIHHRTIILIYSWIIHKIRYFEKTKGWVGWGETSQPNSIQTVPNFTKI